MPRPVLLLAALALGPLAACAPSSAAVAPTPSADTVLDRGAFVVRMGTDTVAVESYTRTADRLRGELVLREPRTATRSYTAHLRPDGTVSRMEVRLHTIGTEPPLVPYTFHVELSGDTARSVYTREAQTETTLVPGAAGAVPTLRYSFALQQLAIARARRGGAGRAAVLPVGGRETMALEVAALGGDSLRVVTGEGPGTAWADGAGRLVRWDGSPSTVKVTAERVAAVDVARLAAEFARRDVAGSGLGALSPRDSVSARIGAASVSVAYGRPARRGRQVLGLLVPWDTVWRAGANLITRLSTDRELRVGETWLPAGSYGLFSVATPSGWTLVVNQRVGVSGTQYDPALDLARIPMAFTTGLPEVERFTVRLVPEGEGGTLRLAWDTWEASVPLRAR